ncbi:fimbrial biogenesis chaperone [Variovorax boronicumulans]|uniref:fimbrial biogenesis chaperone n=1 Tax=Variovorax boronicumulans TaxID=436515 RepID=UPI00339AEC6D
MRRALALWPVLLAPLLAAVGVQAASLSVAPLRIVLTPERPVASLTMGNTDEAEVAVQAEVVAWSQEDGRDVYAPTREVLVNPAIFKLPPGGRQIVRLGLQVPADARERSYRVFLRQLPRDQALPQAGAEGPRLQTLLRIGIPVFVPPHKAQQAAGQSLQWRLQSDAGRLRLVLDNQGSEHIQVTRAVLRRDGGAELLRKDLSVYVLAGQSAGIPLDLPALPPDTRLQIEAATDAAETPFNADVRVPRAAAAAR